MQLELRTLINLYLLDQYHVFYNCLFPLKRIEKTIKKRVSNLEQKLFIEVFNFLMNKLIYIGITKKKKKTLL